jgi:hypothetical protein
LSSTGVDTSFFDKSASRAFGERVWHPEGDAWNGALEPIVAGNPQPFEDVMDVEGGFSIPSLKWRELVFIGALREVGPGVFARDPAREMPPFRRADLFPEGARFAVTREGERVRLLRV